MDLSAGLAKSVRLALVFPGQGSQKPAMGRTLMVAHPAARRRLAVFSEVVDTDLEALLCGDELKRDPLSVHLAMVSFGILAWEWLSEVRGLRPQLFAGHSLGEIVALSCAGALSAENAIKLALVRGQCLAEACEQQPGGMKAFVGVPLGIMQAAIQRWISASGCTDLWIVNINGPQQLVVAGDIARLHALETAMKPLGLTAITLATAGAFHTPFMNSAALKLADFLCTLDFRASQIPVVSSMTGRLLTQPAALATHLVLQVVKPVRWLDVMHCLRRAQITQVVEVASGKGVLSPLIASCEDWPVETLGLEGMLGEEANVKRGVEEKLSA